MGGEVLEVASIFEEKETATEVIEPKVEPKPEVEPKVEPKKEPESEVELDENGKPIEDEPKLDEDGKPIEKSEPELDENGDPIESEELLPEFKYGDQVYKAEQIAELIELRNSEVYEILTDEKNFDRVTKEFTIYKENRRAEGRAKDSLDQAKEISAAYDETKAKFERDIGEDLLKELREANFSDVADTMKELYSGFKANQVDISNLQKSAQSYASRTTMEVVVREVQEYKNITSDDILAAFKDPNHEFRAEAILLNDIMKKSTTNSAYAVVDELNTYFGKTRKSEGKLAETIARKNNKKTSQFGWTTKTETSTKPKTPKKKEDIVADGVIQVDAISENEHRPNPYLQSAPT